MITFWYGDMQCICVLARESERILQIRTKESLASNAKKVFLFQQLKTDVVLYIYKNRLLPFFFLNFKR